VDSLILKGVELIGRLKVEDEWLKRWIRAVGRRIEGKKIKISNGKYWTYGKVLNYRDAEVEIESELREVMPLLKTTLVLAVAREDTNREQVAIASEYGIERLIFFSSKRSFKRKIRLDRLERVALEYSMRVGRVSVPQLTYFEAWDDLLEFLKGVSVPYKVVLYEKAKELFKLEELADPNILVFGPEGGFEEFEIEDLKKVGCKPLILKAPIFTAPTALSHTLAFILDRFYDASELGWIWKDDN